MTRSATLESLQSLEAPPLPPGETPGLCLAAVPQYSIERPKISPIRLAFSAAPAPPVLVVVTSAISMSSDCSDSFMDLTTSTYERPLTATVVSPTRGVLGGCLSPRLELLFGHFDVHRVNTLQRSQDLTCCLQDVAALACLNRWFDKQDFGPRFLARSM